LSLSQRHCLPTHHDFFEQFEKRGLRFVENEKISTAGGLTSGIDLALRVVDRYFGRDVAQQTATYMEYQAKAGLHEITKSTKRFTKGTKVVFVIFVPFCG